MRWVSDQIESSFVVLISIMERDCLVEFQVVREISARGIWVEWVMLSASDPSNGDIRLATTAAAGLSVDNPICFRTFGINKVPIWEVIATSNVIVEIGMGRVSKAPSRAAPENRGCQEARTYLSSKQCTRPNGSDSA